MKHYSDLAGRLLVALFFAFRAYDIIARPGSTKATIIEFGIAWQHGFWMWAAAVFLVLGSLLLAFGYRSKLAAVLLLFYYIPTTVMTNPFWQQTGAEFVASRSDLLQDLAVVGALLLIASHGTGKFAVRKLLATASVR